MQVEFTSFSCTCGETDLVAGMVPNSNVHSRIVAEERVEVAKSAFGLCHDGDKCVWESRVFTLQVPEYLLAPPEVVPKG